MSLKKYKIKCVSEKKNKFPKVVLKYVNKNENDVDIAFPKDYNDVDALLVYLDGNNHFVIPEIPENIILIIISNDFRKSQYYKWGYKNAKWMPRICLCHTKSIDLLAKNLTHYRTMVYPLIRRDQNCRMNIFDEIFKNYEEINNIILMILNQGYFLNTYNQPKNILPSGSISKKFVDQVLKAFTIEELIKSYQKEIGFTPIFPKEEKIIDLDFKSEEKIEIWLISCGDFDYECQVEIQTLENKNKQDLLQLLIKKMTPKNEFTIRLDNRNLKKTYSIKFIKPPKIPKDIEFKPKIEVEDSIFEKSFKSLSKLKIDFLKYLMELDEVWIIKKKFYDFSPMMNKIYSMIEQNYVGG